MKYNDDDKRVKEITLKNAAHLDEFRKDLKEAGVDKKTVRNYINHADDYLENYLAKQELLEMAEGASGFHIDAYMGDFLIRQSLLASEDITLTVADSIKAFYSCMLQRGLIEKDAYEDVVTTIEEFSPEWKAKLDLFQGTGRLDPFAFL